MNPDISQSEQPSSTDCLSYADLLIHKVLPKTLSDEVRAKIEAHIPLCKLCQEVSGKIQGYMEEGRRITQQRIDQIPFPKLMAAAEQTVAQGDAGTASLIVERCIKYIKCCTRKSTDESIDPNLICARAILNFISKNQNPRRPLFNFQI